MLVCPNNCGSLREELVRNVPVDRCERCSGAWMPAESLRRFLGSESVLREFLDSFLAGTNIDDEGGSKKCPIHPAENMKRISQNGVELDMCVLGAGIWFDAGELMRVSAHSRLNAAGSAKSLGALDDEQSGAVSLWDFTGDAVWLVLEIIFAALD